MYSLGNVFFSRTLVHHIRPRMHDGLLKDTVYGTGDDAYDWCLDRDEVVMLEPFGQQS